MLFFLFTSTNFLLLLSFLVLWKWTVWPDEERKKKTFISANRRIWTCSKLLKQHEFIAIFNYFYALFLSTQMKCRGKTARIRTTIHMIFLAFGIYRMWLFISFQFVTFSLIESLCLSLLLPCQSFLSLLYRFCFISVYFIRLSEPIVYIGLCVHNIRNLLVFVASGFRLLEAIVSTKAQNRLIKLCPCKRKKKHLLYSKGS